MTELDELARRHASAARAAYEDVRPPTLHTPGPGQRPTKRRHGVPAATVGALLVAVLVAVVAFVSMSQPDPLTPAGSIQDPPLGTGSVMAVDTQLMDDFMAFATDPSPATLQNLPISPDGLQLGLGERLLRDLPVGDAADPANWQLTAEAFRGYTGPFSALQSIKQHVEGEPDPAAIGVPGAITVSVGDHAHCASPPVPPPAGLEGQRRVSVQPAEDSISSCLAWFSVDLYVDEQGRISAVTLDLWEP